MAATLRGHMPEQLPDFDPYEVLGLDVSATVIEVELAWRAAQRQHHPDVAGADALMMSKRINVARDWLRDPVRRARLPPPRPDGHEPEPSAGGPEPTKGRPRAASPPRPPRSSGAAPPPPRARRSKGPDVSVPPAPAGFDPWTAGYGPASPAIVAILRRLSILDDDDLARVDAARLAPDGSQMRRFLPPDLLTYDTRLAQAVAYLTPPTSPRQGPPLYARAAALGATRAILWADYLTSELAAADAERLLGLMARPWGVAVGQGRYGPRTPLVRAFVSRMREVPADDRRRIGRRAPKPARPWQDTPSDSTIDGLSLLMVLRDLGLRAFTRWDEPHGPSSADGDSWSRAAVAAALAIMRGVVDDERALDWWTRALEPTWWERLKGGLA